jgi:glycosyltransferase involved in cell wall biosynthesis
MKAPDQPTRRVVHVVTSDAFAGIEQHVVNLIREQRRAGWDTHLAASPMATRLRAEAAIAGAHVTAANHPRVWPAQMLRALVTDPPDVLHVHDGRGAALGAVAARATSTGFVRTQHFVETASMRRTGLRHRASLAAHRLINQRVDGFVAVSGSVLEAARRRGELGRAEIRVISPAVTLATDERAATARSRRQTRSDPCLAFTGRLEPERRLDTLLAAIPIVQQTLPACRFVVAGDGAAEASLRQQALALGIESALSWRGWVDDTLAVLDHADAYVNTWPDEAFGMAMAEAMGLELPVIAPDAGANPEMIERGVSGQLFAAGDPGSLAAAIVQTVADRETCRRMGVAARRHALASFGASSTAAAHDELYGVCMRRRGRA